MCPQVQTSGRWTRHYSCVRLYAHNEKKPGENVDHNRGDNYPEEFLANFNPPGFPKTELTLRKGASIMLMRNLDPQEGHCNGARYTVKELKNNLIVAQKASGKNAGILYHIPRIQFHSAKTDVFQFQRRQFPVQPAFSVTANKSQGQTYKKAGL